MSLKLAKGKSAPQLHATKQITLEINIGEESEIQICAHLVGLFLSLQYATK